MGRYLAHLSVAHFELIFVCCGRQRPNFIFLYVDIQLYQQHLLKRLFLHLYGLRFILKHCDIKMCPYQ